ncbi:MAG: TIGR01440 family protein [Treponema sp.]|nr:TIGR01440 family protein [Candidatus Treponema equi]
MKELYNQAYSAAKELIEKALLKNGQVLVVGCSSSEVCGSVIGKESNYEAAEMIFDGIYKACCENDIYLACQCCEHLNRALIIEEELAEKLSLEVVNVVPQPKAGGSFATNGWKKFKSPVAVEHIKAHAGMDIGDTLIGMHLKDVAVPLRLDVMSIGQAHLVCARTRAKYIGGERAIYQ